MIDNIGEAFGYVFKDSRWPSKIGIGALFLLLSFFLVGIPFLLGYMVWITRNVIRKEPYPLPEWICLGQMFLTGLKLLACYLMFLIPLWIIVLVPFWLVSFSVIMSGNWLGIPWLGILYLVIVLGSICYAVFWPSVYLRFVMTDSIGATFSIKEIWGFTKKNIYIVILTILLTYVAALIAGAGAMILFVGIFFTYPYGLMIAANLLGKLKLQADKDAASSAPAVKSSGQ